MVWLFAALVLAGCGSQPTREEMMVRELVDVLPGSYDNLAQSRASPDHPALRLMIVPVEAPLVGDHVFYVQEMAADDLRRVFAQRLYVVNPVPKREQAVLTQLDFKEPQRWRDGHERRELFRALLIDDLRVRDGCDLLWTRRDKGFAATGGTACRTAARDTGETLKVEQRFELDVDGLKVFEQHRDAGGQLVQGAEPDPWYRYSRRVDKTW